MIALFYPIVTGQSRSHPMRQPVIVRKTVAFILIDQKVGIAVTLTHLKNVTKVFRAIFKGPVFDAANLSTLKRKQTITG